MQHYKPAIGIDGKRVIGSLAARPSEDRPIDRVCACAQCGGKRSQLAFELCAGTAIKLAVPRVVVFASQPVIAAAL